MQGEVNDRSLRFDFSMSPDKHHPSVSLSFHGDADERSKLPPGFIHVLTQPA